MASSLKNNKAYTNPQRIIQRKFDVMVDAGKATLDGVAATLEQSKQKVAKERAYQQKQNEIMAAEQTDMYGKINNIGTSGNKALDNNIQDFWYNKVDDYYKIKNAMDKGIISKNEGAKQLASINGLLGKFKEDVKILSSNANAYRQDLEAGNVSNLGSPETKAVLGSLSQNGNVHIVERGGELYYFKPGDTENGVEQGDAIINGGELRAMEGRGENLYKTKVNVDPLLTTAFDKTYMPGQVAGPGYIKTVTRTRDDWIDKNDHSKGKYVTIPEGEKYTFQIIDEQGKADGQAKMISSGVLDPIVNNPAYMESYWEDSIPDEWLKEKGFEDVAGTAWGYKPPDMLDNDWQVLQEQQMNAAKQYLAEQAYNQNADMDQKMKFMSKSTIKNDTPPPSNSNNSNRIDLSQENRLVYNTRYNDYKSYNLAVDNLYKQGAPDEQGFADFMKQYSTEEVYVIPGEDGEASRIQIGNKVINMPTSAAQAKEYLNDLKGIDRESQILFERKNPNEKTVDDYLNG